MSTFSRKCFVDSTPMVHDHPIPKSNKFHNDPLARYLAGRASDWESLLSLVQEVLVKCLGAITPSKERFPCLTHEILSSITRVQRTESVIAVVGAFSRGKSTILNALMGDALLPSGVCPTTATLTWLGSGDAVVIRTKRLPATDFTNQIDPEDILSAMENGLEIQITHPGLRIPATSTFVDTPGFDVDQQAHEETTRQLVTQADYVLFICKPSPGIGGAELEVIRSIAHLGIPYSIVQNERDLLESRSELSRSMHHNQGSASGVSTECCVPRVYAVSATAALTYRLGQDRFRPPAGWHEFEVDVLTVAWAGGTWLRTHIALGRLRSFRRALDQDVYSFEQVHEQGRPIREIERKIALRVLRDAERSIDTIQNKLRVSLQRKWEAADSELNKLVSWSQFANGFGGVVVRFFSGDRRKQEWLDRWLPVIGVTCQDLESNGRAAEEELLKCGLLDGNAQLVSTPVPDLLCAPTDFSDHRVRAFAYGIRKSYSRYIDNECDRVARLVKPSLQTREARLRSAEFDILQSERELKSVHEESLILRGRISKVACELERLEHRLASHLRFAQLAARGNIGARVLLPVYEWRLRIALAKLCSGYSQE